jgi:threonine dehydrogenase-like Zn-dependent dehydrogenase
VGVVWDGGRNVDLVHREVPAPGTGELKIRVEASGLCGTDLHIASGEYPFARPGVTIGHEFAGEVVEIGPDIAGFARGERVVVDPKIPCRTCSYCHASRPEQGGALRSLPFVVPGDGTGDAAPNETDSPRWYRALIFSMRVGLKGRIWPVHGGRNRPKSTFDGP